ncbi:MAG TPA: ankyrin repeat domain-containing protein [Terriglobia bacterium]|nr:ankyrin repeat domain-containing protein [Terriglobia bacterium]
MKSDEVGRFRELIREDPSLATGRSLTSHPTLLQCLVLERKGSPKTTQMASILIEAGAEIDGPLQACASCDNVEVAALLLDRGAAVNGTADWSPLEESLYWNSGRVRDLLLQRGASIHNLRLAAGLGRTDLIPSFFDTDGTLKAEAGRISWPWGTATAVSQSNLNDDVKQRLLSRMQSWANDEDDVINNAFVFACMHGHQDAARLLLERGARINAIPGGFDFSGTALHYAALNGHRATVEFLVERGAAANIRDTKVGSTPAGWAEYGGHPELQQYLERIAQG